LLQGDLGVRGVFIELVGFVEGRRERKRGGEGKYRHETVFTPQDLSQYL
jgi:hypothetical protein